jgi:2-haloacid dehalogenase
MLNFMEFRALSFDCYGTLIDWESGILGAMRPILAAHHKSLPDSALLELYGELEAQAEEGEFRPYREVLQSVVRAFGERLEFAPAGPEISSLPDSLAGWKPFPDTVAALHRLQSRYQLAVISNVDDELFAPTAAKLEVKFDHIITAQQARAYKPSPSIFKLAEKRIGVTRAQWLHVAQSVYHDVVPASSLGIANVWVNRRSPRTGAGTAKAASAHPDLEVPDLQTLAGLATSGVR